MAIWGHDVVNIEKDTEKKEWRLYTLQGGYINTVPWSHVLDNLDPKQYPDLTEAISTCQYDEVTALTKAELRELRRAREAPAVEAPAPPLPDADTKPAYRATVLSLEDFRKRKR